MNPTGVGRTNDYVERTPARTSEFAAKTSTRKAEVNIGGRVTYNPLCGIPHNGFLGGPGAAMRPAYPAVQEPQTRLTPPLRRTPPGQDTGIRQAHPEKCTRFLGFDVI
jgi:hypothetical protein